jgi:phospho-N-acetylmuramoyl-pentapeptide-transferase
VTRVLAAGIVAMVVSIVVGPKFIEFLRRREFGQFIRAEGPERHAAKQGTPTMGGLLILFGSGAAFLALSRYTAEALTVAFTALACGAVGFVDDYLKVRHRRSLGLSGRWKLLLLGAITVVVGWVAHRKDLETAIEIPVLRTELPLSLLWFPLLFLVIAGAANGVNLTDGVDGLAAGTGIIALFALTGMNIVAFIRSGQQTELMPLRAEKQDLAILGAALLGGAIGFLWYNASPAEVFMGDTGAMALGGAIGAFAIMMKIEVLLLLVGGIFVIEALSVMIQVFSFKYWGRRVFLMAPIHHHFEIKAWSETKIMVRFWIAAGILCASAFAIYYRYFFDFIR